MTFIKMKSVSLTGTAADIATLGHQELLTNCRSFVGLFRLVQKIYTTHSWYL